MSATAKTWAAQIRAPFLTLSVALALVGGAVALRDGVAHGGRLALALLGLLASHVAVNLLNELSDHSTGIDAHTRRTPFSGGSGTLGAGRLPVARVQAVAWASMALALAVGAYLIWAAGWLLAVVVAVGALVSVLYTRHLSRWGLGELCAGLCLGALAVMGTYYAQSGQLPAHVVLLGVPPGLLTALLLLLNEFPDVEADRAGGRRHLVIRLGHRRAAWLYALGLAATYGLIVAGVVAGTLPRPALLALLTIPLGVRSARIAIGRGSEHEAMVPALGGNVALVLGTDLLLAAAYLVDRALA